MYKLYCFLMFWYCSLATAQHTFTELLQLKTSNYENELLVVKDVSPYYTHVFYMYETGEDWQYEFYEKLGGSNEFQFHPMQPSCFYDENVQNMNMYKEYILRLLLSKSLLYIPDQKDLDYKINRSMLLEYINDEIMEYNRRENGIHTFGSPYIIYVKRGNKTNTVRYSFYTDSSNMETCHYEEEQMVKEALDILKNEFTITFRNPHSK